MGRPIMGRGGPTNGPIYVNSVQPTNIYELSCVLNNNGPCQPGLWLCQDRFGSAYEPDLLLHLYLYAWLDELSLSRPFLLIICFPTLLHYKLISTGQAFNVNGSSRCVQDTLYILQSYPQWLTIKSNLLFSEKKKEKSYNISYNMVRRKLIIWSL